MSPELAPRLHEISSRLDVIRTRIKQLFLVDGVARLFLSICIFAAATFIIDYLFILPAAIRMVFLLGGFAWFSWTFGQRIVYPMRVKISDDDLAIFVERHYPELKDRLISALQLSRYAPDSSERGAGFNSPELVDALVNDAMQAASQLDFKRVVVSEHVMKLAMWAGGLLLLLGVGAAARPDLAKIHLTSRVWGGTTRWPQRTKLTVEDFKNNRKVVGRGDDLTITVRAKGDVPSKVTLYYKFDTGETGRERMGGSGDQSSTCPRCKKILLATSQIGKKHSEVCPGCSLPVEFAAVPTEAYYWTFTFLRVSGGLSFYLEGNDDVTDHYRVETKNPPAIEEMRIFLDYPDYLGMQNTPEDRPESNPNLQVPLFTRVRFVAVSTEALASAVIHIGAKDAGTTVTLKPEPDSKGVPRQIRYFFDVTETFMEYQITLNGANELANRDPLNYSVKGLPDQRPMPTVLDPVGDEKATELCERPLLIDTKDDHGIREIAVEVKIVGTKSTDWQRVILGKEHNRPQDYNRRQDHIRSEYLLKISELGVKPGDVVVMRIHVEDWKDVGGGGNVVKTKEIKFTIVPITELEKELQTAIDLIKQTLENLRKRQVAGYERVGGLDKKYGGLDEKLGSEGSGEVKSAGLEQNDITSKLDGCRKDIERVMRRGLYNKIFDENAANELGKGVTILKQLADVADPARPATSALASSFITQAARAAKSKDRRDQFSEALSYQSAVIKGIQDALRYLDRWSNYQEVVRMTREILEAQREINRVLPGLNDKNDK